MPVITGNQPVLKEPIYPRPVPPLDLDEIPFLSGVPVYWTAPKKKYVDIEEEAQQRAAKRKRIEAHAHAYLRGEGLFLLSAGVKGPLQAGWQNPWAGRAEVATAPKHSSPRNPQRLNLAQTATAFVTDHPPVNPFISTLPTTVDRQSVEKVEKWLRRTEIPTVPSRITAPISPSTQVRSSPPRSLTGARKNWTPTKQAITVNSQQVRAPSRSPRLVKDSFETAQPPNHGVTRPAVAHDRLQDVLMSDSEPAGHYSTILHHPSKVDLRAETAIERCRTRAASALPTKCEMEARARRNSAIAHSDPVKSSSAPLKILNDAEFSKAFPRATPWKTLSNPASHRIEVKIESRTHESARSRQHARSSAEDVSRFGVDTKQASTMDMPAKLSRSEENHLTSTGTMEPQFDVVSASEKPETLPPAQVKPELLAAQSTLSSGPVMLKQIKSLPSTAEPPKQVEALIPEVETEAGVSDHAQNRSIEESHSSKRKRASPPAAFSKNTDNKRRKTASFIAEPALASQKSDGSIKSAFVVGKTAVVVSPIRTRNVQAKSPDRWPEHDDLATPRPRGTPVSVLKKTGNTLSKLKSVPSSDASASAIKYKLAAASTEAMTSNQNGILVDSPGARSRKSVLSNDEEGFDLDATIDDLGSFLHWSTERAIT